MADFLRINVEKAQELMAQGPAHVVDIRDSAAFSQGHVPEAQNVNSANIDAFLSATDRQVPLICYCYHGISSQQAAAYFSDQGFKKVYSVDGGWEQWKAVYG